MSSEQVLQVRNLKTYFYTSEGVVKAVNGINFDVQAGKTLGIVGESGCGKSVTSLSLLGLVEPPGRIIDGEVILNGRDLLKISREQLRQVRGKEISLIFQDPMSSLNPVLTIGTQVMESISCHQEVSKNEARKKAISLLQKVSLPSPEKLIKRYPFQLSGGMRQRVMIALALAHNPQILIADEPTTALDVTVQAQILLELQRLKSEFNSGIILITHDMGIIAEMADKVAVMYAGSIVEYGEVLEVFENPGHPYTRALLHSLPRLGGKAQVLKPIRGQPPSLLNLPDQCAFVSRCPHAGWKCTEGRPSLRTVTPGHQAACYYISDTYSTEVMSV